jgi:PAS domain-containing protein
MTAEQAEPVFVGAGYAGNWRAIFHDAYGPHPMDWFTEEVERYAWPVFVTNEASDIIAANSKVRALLGIPSGQQPPGPEWNFLARSSDPSYAERLENWDEAMTFVIGLGKGLRRRHVNPERQPPWVTDAYQRFLQGEPEYVTRMLRLWDDAEPLPLTTRMHCPVRWRRENGDLLCFTGVMTVADVWQVLAWHDWIPENAETISLLQELRPAR